jgi:hypothetical protein
MTTETRPTHKVFITDPKNLLTRKREDGVLETIDISTGNVVALSMDEARADAIVSASSLIPRDFVEVVMPSGEKLLVDNRIELSSVDRSYSSRLTPILKDKIFEYIASGDSLYTLSRKRKGMPPYSLLLRWYHRYDEFRDLVDTARKFRAEYLYDRVMQNVDRLEDGNMSKTEVEALNHATNFLKWGTEVSDPVGYSNKKDANQAGVTIIVNTGIDRGGDYVEVKQSDIGRERETGFVSSGEVERGSGAGEGE